MSKQTVRAALLDIDGTLIDSNDAHAHSWVDAFREIDRTIAYESVRPLIGMGGDKLLPAVSGIDPDGALGKALAKRCTAIFKERYLDTVRPFPMVRELLERMRAEGLALVIASSASKDAYADLIRVAGVEALIDAATTSDDAEKSKPDPDIVIAAVKRSGFDARECLMLGDTPYDVQAASGAGVRVAAVRSGGWDDAALHGAISIYADVADLLARYDDSAFAT